MNNITQFPGLYYGDSPAEETLEHAKKWNLECVLVIGQDDQGKFHIGANHSEIKDMLWLLQRAIWWLGRQEETIG